MALKQIIIDYKDFDLDTDIMERNSLVMNPAHERSAHFFSKERKPNFFAVEEKRMIVGVAIEANKPIYRNANAEVPYDHEVVFPPETVEYFRNSFHKSENSKRINFDHKGKDSDSLILVQSYLIGGDNNPKLPKILEGQNINDGSWILGYYVEDVKLWNKIKAKGYTGFSVEVYPYLNLYKNFSINKSKPIKMRKRTMWANFFKSKFEGASVTDLDGNTYSYNDEEIIVGTTVLYTSNEEGEETPATNVDTIVTYSGEEVALTTDEDGVVQAMANVNEEEVVAEEILEEFSKVIRQQFANRDAEIARLRADFQSEIDALKRQVKSANARSNFSTKKVRVNGGKSSDKSVLDLM